MSLSVFGAKTSHAGEVDSFDDEGSPDWENEVQYAMASLDNADSL